MIEGSVTAIASARGSIVLNAMPWRGWAVRACATTRCPHWLELRDVAQERGTRDPATLFALQGRNGITASASIETDT